MIKIGVGMTASALMCAGAVTLFGSSSGVVTTPYVEAAAINTSNTTVGFADSDLYGMTPADIDRTLDEMQAMGVQNVRILIPWAGVEPAQDFYYWDTVDYLVNAAYERNMGILAVLNSTPSWAVEPGQPAIAGAPTAQIDQYAEFAGLVAERYAGKVSAYEIWNEPNTYLYWAPKPDAAAYTELLLAAYPAIKAADPNATVVGGVLISISNYQDLGINPVNYLQQMYDAGVQGYFDAPSVHPYQYTLPFSQGRPYADLSPINQIYLMHQIMVANGDGDKLIWSSEYGEPTSVVDEATQAAFIQDYLDSWSQIPYAGPSFIYTTRDRDSDSTVVDDTFGVLRDDWTPKRAVDGHASADRAVGRHIDGRDDGCDRYHGNDHDGTDGDRRPDGGHDGAAEHGDCSDDDDRPDRRNVDGADGHGNRNGANKYHDGTDRDIEHDQYRYWLDEHGFDIGQYHRQHRLDVGQHQWQRFKLRRVMRGPRQVGHTTRLPRRARERMSRR